MSVIYKITSPTNRIYIGQSWDFEERISYYRTLNCKGQTKVYNSLNKYGYSNHKIDILEQFYDISQEQLDSREVYWWKHYIDLGFDMLNIREPGKGGRLAETTKIKISKKLKGRKLSPVHKANVIKALIGREMSPKIRQKISESNSGTKNGMFGRTGDMNTTSKKVINTITQEIFGSVAEAERKNGIKKEY